MSIELMNRVWELDMATNEKIVLLAYADHARSDGTCIFPSVGLVARKTGYSEREVQRITRRLGRYLIPDGTGPRGTRRWRLHIPSDLEAGAETVIASPTPGKTPSEAAAISQAERSPRSTAKGVTAMASDKDAMSPLTTAGVPPETAGGDKGTAERVTTVSPESSLTIIEPSSRSDPSSPENEKASAHVSAKMEPPAGADYLNRHKIPEPHLPYADTFHELTGLVPHERVLADWLSTFSIWQAEGIQTNHVRQAFEASGGRYDVVRPRSLTNSAAALSAKAAVSQGKGKKLGWTATSIAEFQLKLDRSRRMQADWYRSRGMAFEDPETTRPGIADIPRILGAEPEEHSVVRAAGDVRAKIGALVKSLGSGMV